MADVIQPRLRPLRERPKGIAHHRSAVHFGDMALAIVEADGPTRSKRATAHRQVVESCPPEKSTNAVLPFMRGF